MIRYSGVIYSNNRYTELEKTLLAYDFKVIYCNNEQELERTIIVNNINVLFIDIDSKIINRINEIKNESFNKLIQIRTFSSGEIKSNMVGFVDKEKYNENLENIIKFTTRYMGIVKDLTEDLLLKLNIKMNRTGFTFLKDIVKQVIFRDTQNQSLTNICEEIASMYSDTRTSIITAVSRVMLSAYDNSNKEDWSNLLNIPIKEIPTPKEFITLISYKIMKDSNIQINKINI